MVFINKNIRKKIYISVLVALCAIFSLFDMLITRVAFPFMITGRIGLANIVVLYAIYKFKFSDVLILVVLKSVLVGFLFGGLVSFVVGLTSSLVSFLGMYLILYYLKEKVTSVGVSVVGGFLHILTQLFVMSIIYGVKIYIIMYYGVFIIAASLVSAIIIGLIVNKLNDYIKIEYE